MFTIKSKKMNAFRNEIIIFPNKTDFYHKCPSFVLYAVYCLFSEYLLLNLKARKSYRFYQIRIL